MTHQTNLFNTDPQVAGFKLDYMEVWNWGTFNDKVYRMNPHGNNSLLTGANASGKSTLIDALLALLVPLQNKRFYNQSSGAEKKGNRTDITYFFGNYGQQQEGESGASSLKLRDKSARSVLLATFNNSDGRVVTLFQIRYYSGEELRTVYGMAHKHLTISQNFATFDSNGVWRKRMEKELNTGSSKRIVEFFNGPKAYEEKMLLVFGMRSDKALTLFNQIVGVKVLNNLDSFIRDNMLEERDAEEKYKELRENFQNLMDAKTSIEKTKEQIRQLEPIDRLAEDVLLIEKSIKEQQSEKDIISYWFAVRTVKLCQEHLERRKSELRQLDDTIKANNAEKRRLDEAKSSLEVAINSDSVGQQIKDIEKEIINLTERFEERKNKDEKYNTLIHKLELPQGVDSSTFQSNKATAQKQKVALQELLDNELAERKRHLQNEKEDIEANIKSHVNTIKYLSEHNNNISGRVAEIRDEIIQHIGATADEIPFIGELIRLKDDEVDLHGGLTKRHESIGKLGNAELVGSAVEGVDVYNDYTNVCDIALGYLQKVNDVLEGTPFKVAYRTRNEFLLYVVNNLPYCKDENGNDLEQGYVIARALDEITSMKVLSRIEGDDTKVSDELLDNLSKAIEDGLKTMSGEENIVKSISLAKLKEMKVKLVSGYTSFWS